MQQQLKSQEQKLQSLKTKLSELNNHKAAEDAQSHKATPAAKPKKTRQILTDLAKEYDAR